MRRRAASDGFTLTEVVVGMTLFAVLAVATLTIAVRTAGAAGQNVRRTAAANLLSLQLEEVRSSDTAQLLGGPRSRLVRVGGTEYTVLQETQHLMSDGTATVCTGAREAVVQVAVRVSVTWPDMGQLPPVEGATLRAVEPSREVAAMTSLVLRVVDAAGDPVPASTWLDPDYPGVQAGADGCATYGGIAPGSYWAGASHPGASYGQSGEVGPVTVAPGRTTYVTVILTSQLAPTPTPVPPAATDEPVDPAPTDEPTDPAPTDEPPDTFPTDEPPDLPPTDEPGDPPPTQEPATPSPVDEWAVAS